MKKQKSVPFREFFKQFPNDDACLEHTMKARYGLQHICRKCGREAKFYRISSERAYACQFCGDHVHPCSGTLFENTHLPLQLWFHAIYLFTNSRHGVPAKELERQLGVPYKTAWRMGHQIRKHMAFVDGDEKLSGVVEVDETMVGGVRKGKRGRGAAGKTVVFGMMEKDGDVMTKVVPNVKRKTLHPIIEANVEKGTEIQSDELHSYKTLDRKGYSHKTVEHGAGEYVKGDTHTNSIEGFWSRLKQSIGGTHVHVSPKHLSSYAGEFEYRYNSRKNAEKMLPELLSTFPQAS
ncbi:MAG: IS1595 family transposase [bacterium]